MILNPFFQKTLIGELLAYSMRMTFAAIIVRAKRRYAPANGNIILTTSDENALPVGGEAARSVYAPPKKI